MEAICSFLACFLGEGGNHSFIQSQFARSKLNPILPILIRIMLLPMSFSLFAFFITFGATSFFKELTHFGPFFLNCVFFQSIFTFYRQNSLFFSFDSGNIWGGGLRVNIISIWPRLLPSPMAHPPHNPSSFGALSPPFFVPFLALKLTTSH